MEKYRILLYTVVLKKNLLIEINVKGKILKYYLLYTVVLKTKLLLVFKNHIYLLRTNVFLKFSMFK